MPFCGLKKGICLKMCIVLSAIISKRSLEYFMCLNVLKTDGKHTALCSAFSVRLTVSLGSVSAVARTRTVNFQLLLFTFSSCCLGRHHFLKKTVLQPPTRCSLWWADAGSTVPRWSVFQPLTSLLAAFLFIKDRIPAMAKVVSRFSLVVRRYRLVSKRI